MKLKDSSVRIQGIVPELAFALVVADAIWTKQGHELVITSLNDGKHGTTSLHYAGSAADLRTNYFNNAEIEFVAQKLRDALGIDFDVIVEKNHIHLEYQPKRR
jgi:hypothetical protein